MKVRLFQSSSILEDVSDDTSVKQTDKRLMKRALLVYEGQFESADGPVEVTSEHLDKLASNYATSHASLSGGYEKHMKSFPPIQVDHSTSGWDTVGRVVGPIELGEHDGKRALYGRLLFLGKDAVERVTDGRWTHLSLGADLENGKMNEMTVTPFPAAPNASLLTAKKETDAGEYKTWDLLVDEYDQEGNKLFLATAIGKGTDNGKVIYGSGLHKTKAEAIAEIKERIDGKPTQLSKEPEGKKLSASDYQNGFKRVASSIGAMYGVTATWQHGSDATILSLGTDEAAKAFAVAIQNDPRYKNVSVNGNQVTIEWAEVNGIKLSGGTGMHPKHEEMKKHLMEKEKLSEKDADDKLSKMTDEDKEKLSGMIHGNTEVNQPENADPIPPMKPVGMTAAQKETFKKLSASFKSVSEKTNTDVKKAKLSIRLSALRAAAKMSPAEEKQIDLEKIAKLEDAAIETMFEVFEKRSPIVLAGTFGTTQAESISSLSKEVKDKKLAKEMLEGMQFSKGMVQRLSSGMPTSMDEVMDMSAMPTSMDVHQQLDAMKNSMAQCCKMMDEGKHDEAKEHLKKVSEHFSKMGMPGPTPSVPGGAEAGTAHLSTLAENLEKLQNQFKELIELTSPLLDNE